MGHRIAEPRITGRALAIIFALLFIPVLCVGTLADLLVQWLFGWCTGWWCGW